MRSHHLEPWPHGRQKGARCRRWERARGRCAGVQGTEGGSLWLMCPAQDRGMEREGGTDPRLHD